MFRLTSLLRFLPYYLTLSHTWLRIRYLPRNYGYVIRNKKTLRGDLMVNILDNISASQGKFFNKEANFFPTCQWERKMPLKKAFMVLLSCLLWWLRNFTKMSPCTRRVRLRAGTRIVNTTVNLTDCANDVNCGDYVISWRKSQFAEVFSLWCCSR